MYKAIQILFIGLIAALLLIACGPSEKDAQQFGFANIAEMKELQAKGFKTKAEFQLSQAKDLGFNSLEEMSDLNRKGFKTKKEFEDLKAVEQADPMLRCSREFDPNFEFPIKKDWKLLECDKGGQTFIVDIQKKGSQSFNVEYVIDFAKRYNANIIKNGAINDFDAVSLDATIEVDCRKKIYRFVGESKNYDGRLATGNYQQSDPYKNELIKEWNSVNDAPMIQKIAHFACN